MMNDIDSIRQLNEMTKRIIQRELSFSVEDWKQYIDSSILTRFPLSWINTVFYTHRSELRKRSNASLCEAVLQKAPNHIPLHIPVYCKSIDVEQNSICLEDPYGTITVVVDDDEAWEAVKGYAGSLLILELEKYFPNPPYLFLYGRSESLNLTLRQTSLTLYGVGKEKTEIKPNIAQYAYEFCDVTGESDAIEAVTCIQNYGRLNETDVKRINPTTIIFSQNQMISYNHLTKKLELQDVSTYSPFLL